MPAAPNAGRDYADDSPLKPRSVIAAGPLHGDAPPQLTLKEIRHVYRRFRLVEGAFRQGRGSAGDLRSRPRPDRDHPPRLPLEDSPVGGARNSAPPRNERSLIDGKERMVLPVRG